MKKLLLILLCLPMIGFGQLTYVPDDNFEAYLEANGMGNGIANDDYVTTEIIDTLTDLNVNGNSISNLTGIEDFVALTHLRCSFNQLTSLDVSNNTSLTHLYCTNNQLTSLDLNQNATLETLFCWNNQLSSLDISNNIMLIELICDSNQLTNLDVSGATALTYLYCGGNQLTTLDVSTNTELMALSCNDNQLTSLDVTQNTNLGGLACNNNQLTNLDLSDNTTLMALNCNDNQLVNLNVRNGNNNNWYWQSTTFAFSCINNPSLTCIEVDDYAWSTSNLTVASGNIDPQHYFSTNCPPPSSIQEQTTNKELLKVTDLLGRETKETNQPLFYIYDNGTVEKRIVIE